MMGRRSESGGSLSAMEKAAFKRGLTAGLALAIAEWHRLDGDSTPWREFADGVGLTQAECRSAGVDPSDMAELSRAKVFVPKRPQIKKNGGR